MTDADAARLQEAFRRESRSFLEYVAQSDPWAGDKDRELVAQFRQMADAELRELEALAQYLDDRHIPLPHPGAFPMGFASFNFMAVRSLVPLLIEHQKRELAVLEKDREALSAAARAALDGLLAAKRKHLQELERAKA